MAAGANLQRVTNDYAPKPYHGPVVLLRSRLEPTGWFFQKDAGWGAFAPVGIEGAVRRRRSFHDVPGSWLEPDGGARRRGVGQER